MNKLGGWWRLWLVASVLLAIPTWLLASVYKDVSEYREGMTRQEAQLWVNAEGKKADLCDISGVPAVEAKADTENGPYRGSFSCTSDQQYLRSFIYALVPGALLAVIGLTLRWVYKPPLSEAPRCVLRMFQQNDAAGRRKE